jgi:hypothetical protein
MQKSRRNLPQRKILMIGWPGIKRETKNIKNE